MDTVINKIYKKEADGKDVFVLECDGIDFIADTVIIATGSKASPKTGSDGSGYELVRQLGIDIVKPLPALVQLVCGDKAVCKLGAGVRSYGKMCIRDRHYADSRETAQRQAFSRKFVKENITKSQA